MSPMEQMKETSLLAKTLENLKKLYVVPINKNTMFINSNNNNDCVFYVPVVLTGAIEDYVVYL